MPEIQRGQQLWDVLLAAAWTLKELKLENNLGFMKPPKLLHFCRTNVCLYSPRGSRAVWCPGWISWEGYLHWVHLLPPPDHGWAAWDPVCSWQGVPWQHPYPGSTDSTATPGLRCPQHPQAAELGVTGITHSKYPHPTGLSSLLPTHSASCYRFHSRKISFAFQAQGRQFKVCKRYPEHG